MLMVLALGVVSAEAGGVAGIPSDGGKAALIVSADDAVTEVAEGDIAASAIAGVEFSITPAAWSIVGFSIAIALAAGGAGITSSWLKIPCGKEAAEIVLGKVWAVFTKIVCPALNVIIPAVFVMLMLPDFT